MKAKVETKNLKSRFNFSFPIYAFIWLLAMIIGALEYGTTGALLGLGSGIFCSLLTLVSLVPFVGIPLYLWLGGHINGFLSALAGTSLICQAFSLYAFLIFVIVANVFISAIVALLILKLLLR